MNRSHLNFLLPRDDTLWPPVSFECLPTDFSGEAHKILAAPFFIRDLSVGDEITCVFDGDGCVSNWKHKSRSDRSILWIHYKAPANWGPVRDAILILKCNIETLTAYKLCAVDVPPDVALGRLDRILEPFIRDGGLVVNPSLRHPEGEVG